MEKQTLIDTAHHIMEGKITNASFSHLSMKFVAKSNFESCTAAVEKAIKMGLEAHDEAWVIQEKDSFNEDEVMNDVTEVNEDKVDAIVFKHSNLVMLSWNYYAFLEDAFWFVNEQELQNS